MRIIDAAAGPATDTGAPSSLAIAHAPSTPNAKDGGDSEPGPSNIQEALPDYGKPADGDIQLGDGATPAGLKNIGNTCYLNSVLQYFFTIKDVRDQVMQAAAVIQKNSDGWKGGELRVGGRLVSTAEIERSRKFVVHLSNLFDNMITSPAAAVEPERELAYLALVSSRTEEAVLSTKEPEVEAAAQEGEAAAAPTTEAHRESDQGPDAMQADTSTPSQAAPSFVAPEADTPAAPGAEGAAPVEAQESTPSQSVLGSLPADAIAAVATAVAAPVASGSEPAKMEAQAQESLMQLGAQQDVGECLDNVVFQIEVGLRTAGAEPGPLSNSQEEAKSQSAEAAASLNSAIERLFVGISSQRVVPITPAPDAKPSDPKREIFTLVPIDITHEGCDVYDGLDNYFDDEQIEGSNVRRTVTLQDPPAILQIQAQRVQFDRQTGKLFKALTHLAVGEFISLDRYLELPADHPGKTSHDERRAEHAKLRKAQADLARKRAALFNGKIPISDTLRQLSSTLHALGSKPDESNLDPTELDTLKDVLSSQASEVQSDIEKLEQEIGGLKALREAIWEGHAETGYELVAVFMHRGEATHGHYFLNQRRLPDAADGQVRWLKYNDEQVCDVTLQEVLKDSTGATPYLLVYVRRRPEPTATIDTVRRQVTGITFGPPPNTVESRVNPTPEPVPMQSTGEPGVGGSGAASDAPVASDQPTVEVRTQDIPNSSSTPTQGLLGDTVMEDEAPKEAPSVDQQRLRTATGESAPGKDASTNDVAMETE